MAEFLTTQGTSYQLENIIKNATKWLVLICPYLDITENFLQRLQDADKGKVKMCMVYGKGQLKPEERVKLQKLENLSLRYYKNLHAKCYLNEDTMIITSMNLLEFSEKTNREMGVLIHREDSNDQQIYQDAIKEVKSIIGLSKEENISIDVKEQNMQKSKVADTNVNLQTSAKKDGLSKVLNFLSALATKDVTSFISRHGYCIRCGREISYDLDKPYCRECFYSWSGWENPSYIENYCHTCGGRDRSSMLYPQCRNCYQKSQR